MTEATYRKNCKRLWISNTPGYIGKLTTDPRRWARTFRNGNQPEKVRRNAASLARRTARIVSAKQL
jgi:hypothetical protein